MLAQEDTPPPVLGRPKPVMASIHEDAAKPVAQKGGNPEDYEDENKVPKVTGKFAFRPTTEAKAAQIAAAEARGEWVEVCNLDECFLEQDFLVVARENVDGERAVMRQQVQTFGGQKMEKKMKKKKKGGDTVGGGPEPLDKRSVFQVRLMDNDKSFKKVESSLLLMDQAKKGIAWSKMRREGGKVM